MLAFEMYERKCTIFHVRILENCAILASETAAYQCSYIHSRDGVCRLWLLATLRCTTSVSVSRKPQFYSIWRQRAAVFREW